MLTTEKIDNITVVRFNKLDRFNALVAEPVKEELKGMFGKPDIKLILSLDGIKFIDSTGFGVFLSILKTANSNQGTFKICDVGAEVLDLFKLLQLHNVFNLYDDIESCVNSFN
ncbi:MAG: STAS domain-containing protein [Bacteroidales bacterium]|nr:STAS domain-containing protein [Bacteroidales bacterium]